MSRTAIRTASVYTRVHPVTKEQAESILRQLGMDDAAGHLIPADDVESEIRRLYEA